MHEYNLRKHIVKGDGNCLYYAVQAGILFNTKTPRNKIDEIPQGWETLKDKLKENLDAEVQRLSEEGLHNFEQIRVNVTDINSVQHFSDAEKERIDWLFQEQFFDPGSKHILSQFIQGEISLLKLYELKLQHHLKNKVFGDYLIVDSLAHLLEIPICVFQDKSKPPFTVNEKSKGQLVCILFDATKPHFDAYLPKDPPAAAALAAVIDLTRTETETPTHELTETPAHELLLCMWDYMPRPPSRV